MENKKIIIFGPWVGEFSYELSWWNPECRKIRNDTYPDHHSIHLGFQGRKAMYKDFIDEYVPYPPELEETLKYPATYGEHINGQDVIPPQFINALNKVIIDLNNKGITDITVHKPKDLPITFERCQSDCPFGEYVHYEVDNEILYSVNYNIQHQPPHFKFSNTIFLMARVRTRKGKTCYLDWNPDNWVKFVRMLIEKLDVNIITVKQVTQGSRGGATGLENHPNLQDLKHKIKDYEITKDNPNSLEEQLALLKLTKCSIYGASGAAVLPFFVNTPTFTQQTNTEGYRLKFGWERDLTDNLKNVVVFDKYKNNEIYNSPVEELFEEFEKFYETL